MPALVCSDLAKQATVVARAIGSALVPLAVLGAHDAKDAEAALWRDVLDESAQGLERGVRVHLNAVLALLQEALASPSWPLRQQAAQALATVTAVAGPCGTVCLTRQFERAS